MNVFWKTSLTVAGMMTAGLFWQQLSRAQQSPSSEFDVASIKRSAGGQVSLGSRSPGTFFASNFSVKGLLMEAYGVRAFQVSGLPGWLDDKKFDVQAKYAVDSDRGQSPELQWKSMDDRLRRLLEDRFRLQVHREQKTLPVYLLTIGKGGHKLPESRCVALNPNDQPSHTSTGEKPRMPCESRYGNKGSNRTLDWTGTTMPDFVRYALPNILGRPVIDNTDLHGNFDVHLEWSPDQTTPGITGADVEKGGTAPPPEETGTLSIFTALQEQLGLRLEAGRGPVEVIVVDHVEMPSEN
jgi:uncharacterized protein (TIGR03435 family)